MIERFASRVTGGHAATYLARGLVVGSNFGVMIALAALLPPQDFGRLVYLWAIATVLSAIGSMGAPAYLLREFSVTSRNDDESNARVSSQLFLMIALVLPLLVIAGGTASLVLLVERTALFDAGITPGVEEILAVGMVAWLINVVNNLANFSRVLGHINLPMVARDAGPQLLLFAATLIGMAAPGDVSSVLAIYHIYVIAAALLLLAWTVQIFLLDRRARTLLAWQKIARWPNLMGFWGLQIINILSASIDILVGGLFLSEERLGFYQLVKRIANLASLPQIVANWAVIVAVGKAYGSGDMDAVRRAARNGARISLAPLLVLAPISAVAVAVIAYWLDYPLDVVTISVAALLLLSAVCNVLFGANYVIASQSGHEAWALLSRVLAVILFGASLVLLSGLTEQSVTLAAAQLISVLASNLILWWFIWRRLKVDSSLFALFTHRHVGTQA